MGSLKLKSKIHVKCFKAVKVLVDNIDKKS